MPEKFMRSLHSAGEGINPRLNALSEMKRATLGGKDNLLDDEQDPKHHEDDYIPVDQIMDPEGLNPEELLILKEELQSWIDEAIAEFKNQEFFIKWQKYQSNKNFTLQTLINNANFINYVKEVGGHLTKRGVKEFIQNECGETRVERRKARRFKMGGRHDGDRQAHAKKIGRERKPKRLRKMI